MKKLTLAAALAATFIAGSAAVAYAGRAGDGGPIGDNTSEAALQDHVTPFSDLGWRAAPTTGSYAYGYVPERRIVRSQKQNRNN